MGLKELATLYVRMRAPREQLKADLEGAKQDVQQFGDQAQASGAKVNASLGSVGDKIKDSTKGVRGFIGSITGVIGAFTRVLGIVGLITGAIGGLIALVGSLAAKSEEVAEAERKATEHATRRAEVLRRIEGQAAGKPEKSEAQKEADILKQAVVDRSQQIANLEKNLAAREQFLAEAKALYELQRNRGLERALSTQGRILRIQEAITAEQAKLKELKDQTERDESGAARLEGAGETIEKKKADEEAHKARMRFIEIEEQRRLQLQIANWNQLQALQQSAAQFNNAFAYDIRRLASTVEQIKGRLN